MTKDQTEVVAPQPPAKPPEPRVKPPEPNGNRKTPEPQMPRHLRFVQIARSETQLAGLTQDGRVYRLGKNNVNKLEAWYPVPMVEGVA